jgi:hypothetical protein
MRRAPTRLAATGLIGALMGACALLPDRYAVNAPLRNLIWGGGVQAATPETLRARLRAADGFTVSLWASDLPNARFCATADEICW